MHSRMRLYPVTLPMSLSPSPTQWSAHRCPPFLKHPNTEPPGAFQVRLPTLAEASGALGIGSTAAARWETLAAAARGSAAAAGPSPGAALLRGLDALIPAAAAAAATPAWRARIQGTCKAQVARGVGLGQVFPGSHGTEADGSQC
jgi:hypothetical protein